MYPKKFFYGTSWGEKIGSLSALLRLFFFFLPKKKHFLLTLPKGGEEVWRGVTKWAFVQKKVKLLMQAPPTDPRTMPAIRMKAQVPCGQQQKM